ncbi:Fic family protein [Staphylococcus rostri]|uniref:Fic family protein n=1 Tax=Staphylococcus rostri TaxID=522262 RepID=UPI0026E10794|nr:Fic family protein [Staphylococcus rostri]
MRELVSNNVVLTEAVIKQTHALLLIGNRQHRGVYRQVSVRIIGAECEPVQSTLIEPSMEKLLREFDASNEHIVTKLAKFHIAFERIHPLIDGNGRTGRLLVN